MSTRLIPPPVEARLLVVIRAFAEVIIAEEVGTDDPAGLRFVEETAEVLRRRLLGMPRYLASGMVAMTLAFDNVSRALAGKAFHDLAIPQRRRVLDQVRAIPVGLIHNFVSFYEKLGVFIYWSLVEESS